MRCKSSSLLVLLFLLSSASEAGPNVEKLARECAAGKQKGCLELARVARTDKDERVRAQAAALLADGQALAEIARTDLSPRARQAALANQRLTDQAVFAALAKGDASPEVRVAAVARLADQQALAAIALGASGPEGAAAMERLEPAGLVEVLGGAKDYSTQQKAAAARLATLLEGLQDPGLLARIATSGTTYANYDLRRKALGRVVDEAVLAQVAANDPVNYAEALKRVIQPDLLRRIATEGTLTTARVQALVRLDNPSALLCNGVLLHALDNDAWSEIPKVAALKFTLSPAARQKLEGIKKPDPGLRPNGARALLAGVPVSTWPKLRADYGVRIASEGGAGLTGVLPPGAYAFSVGFDRYDFKSTADIPIAVDLKPKTCYVLESGQISSSWAPRLNTEPCPSPKP